MAEDALDVWEDDPIAEPVEGDEPELDPAAEADALALEALLAAAGPERIISRIDPDTRARAKYWAKRHGLSLNAYVVEAVDEKVRRENLDYDLPTMEIARLNQLLDVVMGLSTNVANLERTVGSSLTSLIGLTRGDNYLLDDEAGDL